MAMKNRGASSAIQAYQNRLKQLYDATNNAAAQQMNAQSRAGVQSMNNAFKSVPQPSTQGGMADFSSGLSAIQKAMDEAEKARLKAEEAAAKEAAAAQKKAAKEAEKKKKAQLEELSAAEEAKAEADIDEIGSGKEKYEAVIGKNTEEETYVYLPSLPKEEEIVRATEKLNSARTLADAQNYITALRKIVSDAKSGDIDGGYYTTSMRAAIIKADEAIQTATDNIQNQVYKKMEQRDMAANKTSAFEKMYSDMKAEDREALDLLALHEIVGDQFGHDVEPSTENKNSLSRDERNELWEQLKKAGYNAQEIIDYRVNMYSAAERERSRLHLEEEMNKSAANTVLANAGTVIGSIPANIMGAADIILQEAKRTITGSEAPINTNSQLQSFSNANNDVRAITSEKIRAALDKDTQSEGLTAGNAAAFGYQTVMSSLDSVMAAMTPGGVAMIGLGAGLDATKGAIESGASAEEAIAYGLLAGAFESFFEEKSIGNFKEYFGTKALRGKTGKELAKTIAGNLAKSMTTNASEEFLTQLADDIAEALILADKSALAKVYDSAIANGASREEAASAVAMHLAKDTVMAGVGGALQGLLMGSVGSIGGGMTRAAFGEYYEAAQDVNERLKAGEITEEQATEEKAQAQKNFGIDQQDALRIDLQAQMDALGDAIREAAPDIAEEADAMAEAAAPAEAVNGHVQNIMDKLRRGERLVNHDAEAFYLNGRSDVDARMKNVEALAEALGEDAAKLKNMTNAEMREYVKALTADRFSAADNAEAFAQDTMVDSDLNATVSENATVPEMENAAAPKAASVSAVDRAVERMAFEGISPEAEALFRENADGKRINDYSTKFQKAYLAGYNGDALSTAGADGATAAVMQQAYKLAQRERSETARAENLTVVSAEVADDKNNRGLRFVEAPSDTSAAAMRSVEQVQKIAKNFGHEVYFVENAAFQGKLYKNAIYLNANMTGNQMLQRTLGHELTHTLEKGKQYSRLYNYVLGSESIKVWAKNQDRYTAKTVDGIAREIARTYEKAGIAMDGERGGMGQNDPYTEIVADFCGDVLLGESDISERAIRELCGENRSLAQRIRDAIASMMELLRGTKKEDELRHVLRMFEEGLKTSKNLSIDADAKTSIADDNGNVVAEQDGGNVSFSLSTYETEGKQLLESYLNNMAKRRLISKSEAKDIAQALENVHDVCREMLYEDENGEYKTFGAWSDAKIKLRDDGTPVMSCIVSNSEYEMDIDFSQICTKRGTLNKVLNEMARRGVLSDINMDVTSIAKINKVIKNYGFDIACTMCYVESKRDRTPEWAKKITEEYNNILEASGILNGNSPDKKAMDNVVKKIAEKAGNAGKGPRLLMDAILKNPDKAVKLVYTDLISSDGIEKIKANNQPLYSAIIQHDGSGSPKAPISETQYQSELLKESAGKNVWNKPANEWDTDRAFSVGGVRLQSFSDFVPKMFFDYCQVMADMTAKRLPMHGYSKVESFIRLFGLSGAKLNISCVPTISVDGKTDTSEKAKLWAGFVCDANGTPIKGTDGKYLYAWADESFDFDTAVSIQSDEWYSKNCGICAIGVSDNHIWQMLNDQRIKMIVPYHKSSLNPEVAKMHGITAFKDYTNYQTHHNMKEAKLGDETWAEYYNRVVSNWGKQAGSKNDTYYFDFYNKLTDSENPAETAMEYLKDCQKNDIIPKFAQFAYNEDGSYNENYYKLLTDFTLTDSNGEFSAQEVVHFGNDALPENWVDILKDALRTEQVKDDRVDALMPDIIRDVKKALGDSETDVPKVNKPVVRDKYSNFGEQKSSIPSAEMQNHVRYSIGSTDSAGNALTDAQREYFKDSKVVDEDGNLRVVYHGTDADFTVFDKTKGRSTMDIQGMFFSPYDIDAAGYGGKVGEYYLNIKNPASEGTAYKALNQFKGENNAGVKAREYLESLGYDGVYNGYDEYIAFDSNQIKRIDNRNPTSNPDIRYSIGVGEKITKSNRELVKENQRLSEQVKLLKQEMKLSGGHVMNDAAVNRLVSRLRRQNKSAIDSTMLKGQLSNLFQYIANAEELNWDEVMDVSADIARNILDESSSTGKSLRETDDRHAKLWEDLKEVTVKPKMLKSLEAAFGNRMFGKIGGIKVNVDENAKGIDDLYHNTLRTMYPEYFVDGLAEEDVFERMMEVRQAINEPVIDGHDGMTYDEAAYDLAQQIWDAYLETPEHHTFADKKKAEREAIVAKYRQRMVQQRNDSREKYEERLADVRAENAQTIKGLQAEIRSLKVRERKLQSANNAMAKSSKREAEKLRAQIDAKANKIRELRSEKNQKIADTQARYRDIIKNQRQQRKMTELRNDIKKTTKWFQDVVTHPTNARHTLPEFQGIAADVAEMMTIATATRDATSASSITAVHDKLEEMLKKIGKVQKNVNADTITQHKFGQIAAMVENLRDALEDDKNYKRTGEMTLYELEELKRILRGIQYAMQKANTLVIKGKQYNTYKAGEMAANEVRSSKGVGPGRLERLFDQLWGADFVNGKTFFNKLSGWSNGIVNSLRESIDAGQRKMIQIQMEAANLFASVTGKENAENMKRFAGRSAELVDIGIGAKLTHAELCSLYMHLQNQQNADHIIYGGMVLPNRELYNRGLIKDAYAQGVTITLDAEEIANIQLEIDKAMDDYDRKWVKLAKVFFNEFTKNYVNGTSLRLVGYEKATVENYFPIYSDDGFVNQSFEDIQKNGSVMNPGFLKDRVQGAKNPIRLVDINRVVQTQADGVAKYAGLAEPIQNFQAIWNAKQTGYRDSFRNAVQRKWGKNSESFIEKYMADVQNAVHDNGSNMSKKLTDFAGNYAASVLTMNPTSALAQISLSQAGAVIGNRNATRAYLDLFNVALIGGRKRSLDKINAEIAEHSPMQWVRQKGSRNDIYGGFNYGGYGSEDGGLVSKALSKVDYAMDKTVIGTAKDKAENVLTTWISRMDENVIAAIWQGAKYKAEADGLAKGSEQYWNEVTDLFNRAVEETQPQYLAAQQTQISRDKSMRVFTMFKAPMMATSNVVYNAVGEYMNGKRDRKAAEKLGKTFASIVVGCLMSAFLKKVLGNLFIYHKPDRDETGDVTLASTAQGVAWQAAGNIVSSVQPVLGGEVFSAIQAGITHTFYSGMSGESGVENISKIISIINKISSRSTDIVTADNDEDRQKALDKMNQDCWDILASIMALIGQPATAVKNWKRSIDAYADEWMNGKDWMQGNYQTTTANVTAATRRVLRNTNYTQAKMQGIVDRYFDTAVSSDPRKSIRTALTKEYKSRYVDADEAERKRIAKMLTGITDADDSNLFTQDDLDEWVKDDIKASDDVQSAIDKASVKVTGIPEDDAKAVNENLKTKVGYAAQANQGYSVKWGSKAEEKLYKDTGGDLNAFARQLAQYGTAMKAADNMGNDNGNISQEELENYLNASSHSKQMKAYIWALKFPNAENPYT